MLLPFLEERRRECLAKFASRLHLPVEGADGQLIESPEDLELGHLWLQVCTSPLFDANERVLVGALRELRNTLAHLEVPSAFLVRRVLP